MKQKQTFLRITTILSFLVGTVFFFILSLTTHENHIQYGLLGFIIGFPIIWVIYLAVWFIRQGISRTPFPSQSAFIINRLKQILNMPLTIYQEKMLVEITGAFLLIAVALGLAGATFIIVSGILFIVGRLSW
jgi:hypothetical protein